MTNCSKCGTKIRLWDEINVLHEPLCFKCYKEKQDNVHKNKLAKDWQSKNTIKEIKCKCNQCGAVWHYLEQDERQLRSQATNNALIGCGMCCNPFGALFSNKSLDLQREIAKLNKCPKCNSVDIKKTPIYHEKKY